MCRTGSSIRGLTRTLDLRLDEPGPAATEAALRDYDRREREAVVAHLLGMPPPSPPPR